MSFGQEPAAEDVNQIALEPDDAVLDQVGIGQVGAEQLVARARARAEEQRQITADAERQQDRWRVPSW